jgi:DNA-binding Lrp family transcriptional regulator
MHALKSLKRYYLVYFRDRVLARRDLAKFYSVLGGHIYFELLYAAVELDLFSLLEERGALSLQDIAKSLGIGEFSCKVLLLGLTATGVIKKRGEKYSNTYVGSLILVKGSSMFVGNCVRWQHDIVYRPMFRLLESIRESRHVGLEEIPGSGDTLYERLSGHPRLEKIFQDAMEEISYQTSSLPAEAPVGGVQINMIPRDGGNEFRGTIFATGGTSSFQSNNSDDELEAMGFLARNRVKSVYDVNVTYGGPILRNRLWYWLFGTDDWVAASWPSQAARIEADRRAAIGGARK